MNKLKITRSCLLLIILLTWFLQPVEFNTLASVDSPQNPDKPTDTHETFIPIVRRSNPASPGPSPTPPPIPTPFPSDGTEGWPMAGANPQRTSWTEDEVSGSLHVEWYRPVEAYIPQNVQLIAAYGLIYVTTSNGLLALNAANGELVWRFDTDLPLGNSPTASDEVIYVGGHDRKLHALNALSGEHLWAFEGAQAGYDTNPLVIDGKVIIGNRDGAVYAIGAHGSPNQGDLLWKFQTGGPVHYSPAYQDGVVYFASNDNHAYALNANNGSLIWKSQKLPGDGYHSFWPVIYGDYVIFSAASPYRTDLNPGTRNITNDDNSPLSTIRQVQGYDLFYGEQFGAVLGPTVAPQSWASGNPVIDASRVTEYLENNPNPQPHRHMPWRRSFIMLERSSGNEYTFDSDGDGYGEYMPYAWWGTNSGNRYPPIVGSDGIIYANNMYEHTGDPKGRVMGWRLGTKYLSIMPGQGAIAEPQAISAGGSKIYRSLCCDRVGDFFDIEGSPQIFRLWSYDLSDLAPGYDEMWKVLPGWPRLHGYYRGKLNTENGAYHNHGDQNPIIPYNGRLYIHRSNAILAFGPGTPRGKLPAIAIQNPQHNTSPISADGLRSRLNTQIQKIVDAGHLRPGYYNTGQFMYPELADYFENPGDTLYTLSIAYPHLSSQLQGQVRSYLQRVFQDYFDPEMYATTGWADGAARESMPLPPEVQNALSSHQEAGRAGNFSWNYPQHNFYALWKYVQIFPGEAGKAYDLAKSKLQVPLPNTPVPNYFEQKPFELNAYIAGYTGFLHLQELAGRTSQDAQLRSTVQNELNRLLALRANTFTKDSYWGDDDFRYKKSLDISRNFIYLVPELGDYLRQNILSKASAAVAEYEYIAPYWFVSRFESVIGEGAMSNLYNYHGMFLAKAYILKESGAELSKYVDVPGFERGDLFHIQNLVAAIEAYNSGAGASAQPESSGH